MSNLHKIDSLLRNQPFSAPPTTEKDVYDYARSVADMECAIVVVSDLKLGTSRIFCGNFASVLGIGDYKNENSIWEKEILRLMGEREQEEKYLCEIRFFNFIRKQPKRRRPDYYLLTALRFKTRSGAMVDVSHKMFYQFDENGAARYGICIYTPFGGTQPRCIVVNRLTGETLDLGSVGDLNILSMRERQVLKLIDRGLTSKEISSELHISSFTVSRHRQEILAKLQVRNSTEACRIARQLSLI